MVEKVYYCQKNPIFAKKKTPKQKTLLEFSLSDWIQKSATDEFSQHAILTWHLGGGYSGISMTSP